MTTPMVRRGPIRARRVIPSRDGACGRAVLAVLAACGLLVAAGCQDPAGRSIERGDRLMAVGEPDALDAAIAEYKLAQRQRGDAPEILLRLGHAYSVRGDVDEALEHYESLAETRPDLRHQIAGDLVQLAVDARERGAEENMARALRPLLEWGLGFVPGELLLSLARHYGADGDHPRSLGLYLAVLGEEESPAAAILYETARAYEELGGCDRALPYFERYMELADRRAPERNAARFHYGNCLFVAADEDRAAGRPAAALEKLNTMVSLGVPRTLLPEAHFLRGEMLLSLGNTESALGAYQRVLDLTPSRTGAMVRRAEERIRQIRFGFEND